jgi:hypothetical protein
MTLVYGPKASEDVWKWQINFNTRNESRKGNAFIWTGGTTRIGFPVQVPIGSAEVTYTFDTSEIDTTSDKNYKILTMETVQNMLGCVNTKVMSAICSFLPGSSASEGTSAMSVDFAIGTLFFAGTSTRHRAYFGRLSTQYTHRFMWRGHAGTQAPTWNSFYREWDETNGGHYAPVENARGSSYDPPFPEKDLKQLIPDLVDGGYKGGNPNV